MKAQKRNKRYQIPLILFAIFLIIFAGLVVFKEFRPGSQPSVTWMDDPELDDTAQVVQAFAQANGYSYDEYPDSLVELLDRNPETEDFVLNYPEEHEKDHEVDLSEYSDCESVPLFMQWDSQWGYLEYGSDVVGLTGCGPVCLAMAGYYWTHDDAFSPDNMVSFALKNGYCVKGSGSSWTLISEGGEKLGLDVTEIPLDENRIIRNLEVGNPIICVMGPGDFTTTGHFIVMTGYENGQIRINDPNSYANSNKLWNYEDICDQIRNLWVIRE